MYRVRKNMGECLVDMSHSLMLLSNTTNHALDSMDTTDDANDVVYGMRKSKCAPVDIITLAKKYSKMKKEGVMNVVMEMDRK